MRIGIVRHFKVNISMPRSADSEEFTLLVKKYSEAPVIANQVDLKNIEWKKCYASTMSRAITTAEAIFKGEILKYDHIREVDVGPIFNTKRKFPVMVWDVLGRIGWLLNHKSQPEKRRDTRNKVKEFVDMIIKEEEENILVVCHGFLMISLQRELKRRGFKGKHTTKAENGTLYLYEK